MKWLTEWNIILASKSPRRAELLRMAGFTFTIRSKEVDESFPKDMDADQVAEYLAIKKARAQAPDLGPKDLLIAADSVVILEHTILNKPANNIEAQQMLRALSGKEHRVITGVCILIADRQRSFSSCSRVFMESLTDQEIDHYIDNYQPFDKAGSYGIQEWIGINRIKRIDGSYTNIMGLPTAELYEELLKF
jgi:septum formation protein